MEFGIFSNIDYVTPYYDLSREFKTSNKKMEYHDLVNNSIKIFTNDMELDKKVDGRV